LTDKKHPYQELIIDYAGEWIIPGADDEKGHNVTEKTNLPKTWLAQMDRMVKYSRFPYINRGQIVRHALFMLFTWIDTIPKKQIPRSDLRRMESMRMLLIEEAMLAGFSDVILELDRRVKYCKNHGMRNRAVKHVYDILRIAEEIKEDDWREYFVNKIRETYKQLLDSVKDICLYSSAESEKE